MSTDIPQRGYFPTVRNHPAAVLEPNSEPGRHNSNGFRVEVGLSTRAGLWRAGQEISEQTEI